MRKIVVVLVSLFFCFSFQISHAQRGFGILKIGLNASYLNPDLAYSNRARFGINIGLAPTVALSEHVYLKPEISFSMKGGIAYYDQPFFDGSVRYRLNYFEMPVMLGIRATKKVAFEAGPYGALRAGSRFDFNGDFFYGYGSFEPGDLSNYDYGLAGGIVFTGRVAIMGIRYYHGMKKINSNPDLEDWFGDATNHTVQIYFQRNPKGEARKKKVVIVNP